MPRKASLKFKSIAYSALDGGWNLTAVISYPGTQKSPLLYFALRAGSTAPSPAAPFQLTAKQDVHVFITADSSPTPTDAIVYAATSNNQRGKVLLTVAIPASVISD